MRNARPLGCTVILGLLRVTPGDEIRLVGTATICGHVMCNEASVAQFAVQVRDAGLIVPNRGESKQKNRLKSKLQNFSALRALGPFGVDGTGSLVASLKTVRRV